MPGQTLSEIRALLDAAGLAPQHRFGQNFLIDLNLMRKLVAAAEIEPADTVLEVGAGTGSLTELLLDTGARVVAVEIDRGLQGILRERLGGHARLALVQGDALSGKHRVNTLVLSVLAERPPAPGGHYKLVANLPYQIATPLLADLLVLAWQAQCGAGSGPADACSQDAPPHGPPGGALCWQRLTCTIQREVGERLAAAPRSEAYGPVSVLVQTLADVLPHAILPPTAFWPRPQVESLMLTLRPRPPEQVEVTDVPGLRDFVQQAFQQRRKMLRRLLRGRDESAGLLAFGRAGVSPDARPEELSPAEWRRLFHALAAVPLWE